MPKTSVQETRDYSQFSFITANRDYNRGHVEKLKIAFSEVGNLTKVQPILVNENMQIIDGQHRFVACSELGLPVYYTVQNGLGIKAAVSMNILHRKWTAQDYLKTYVEQNYPEYIKFKTLLEDFGFNHSITLEYCGWGSGQTAGLWGGTGRLFKTFREGDLNIEHYADTRANLAKLGELAEITPFAYTRGLAIAFLRVITNSNYDHKRMMKKMKTVGARHLQGLYSTEDNIRMLENIYNNGYSSRNHVRFY